MTEKFSYVLTRHVAASKVTFEGGPAKVKTLHPCSSSIVYEYTDIDSVQPRIMGLYLLMVSHLAQSLCKCRWKPHITVVCWKTKGFSNHVPSLLIQLPVHRPTLWLVPDLLWVQSNYLAWFSHCCWHSVTCRKWLRIVTVTMLMDQCQTTAVYWTTQNILQG